MHGGLVYINYKCITAIRYSRNSHCS